MEFVLSRFVANINEGIFLKDPESSLLGRNILEHSAKMISTLGFEEFTFRKLSLEINSTEASIYRYFDNKQKLLIYLSSVYWGLVEYKIVLRNANIGNPKIRLSNAIELLTNKILTDENPVEHINLKHLYHIICIESSKAYLTKGVDSLNKNGAYSSYKKLVSKISEIITEVDPKYKYPRMLTTTLIEGIHHQIFFKEHLHSLTDITNDPDTIIDFYTQLVFSQLKIEN